MDMRRAALARAVAIQDKLPGIVQQLQPTLGACVYDPALTKAMTDIGRKASERAMTPQ